MFRQQLLQCRFLFLQIGCNLSLGVVLFRFVLLQLQFHFSDLVLQIFLRSLCRFLGSEETLGGCFRFLSGLQ